MSHIPSSAMPHAGPSPEAVEPAGANAQTGPTLSERAGKIADAARANPKTAIAAGAAVVAGVVAAAAIPLVRAQKKPARAKTGSTGTKKKS